MHAGYEIQSRYACTLCLFWNSDFFSACRLQAVHAWLLQTGRYIIYRWPPTRFILCQIGLVPIKFCISNIMLSCFKSVEKRRPIKQRERIKWVSSQWEVAWLERRTDVNVALTEARTHSLSGCLQSKQTTIHVCRRWLFFKCIRLGMLRSTVSSSLCRLQQKYILQ